MVYSICIPINMRREVTDKTWQAFPFERKLYKTKYRFPADIDFNKCRETIANALNDNCTRWCKREHVESNALSNWKLKIFKIIDERELFYSNNLDLLPPKPKLSFRYLKQGIQEFHRKYVLAPAYKAANNFVVV